jgi:hypothetical protein
LNPYIIPDVAGKSQIYSKCFNRAADTKANEWKLECERFLACCCLINHPNAGSNPSDAQV